MEQRIENILNQNLTKTKKIRELILLGLTRKKIAELVTNGNYGFVQNVYAKMRTEGILNTVNHLNTFSPFRRNFGVEFEAYNISMQTLNEAMNRAGISCNREMYNHATQNYWKIVTDSSISGSNSFELVSPILKGEQGLEELKTVCRVLNECGAKINKSCGTHVHFDASGFDMETWKRLYVNYKKLETTIDGFMPQSRRDNRYCQSFENIVNFESKINACSTLKQIETVFGYTRYYKINPMSYARHKTCEFRQHSGTVEFEKIGNWIKFLNNLVEFSKTATISDTTIDGLKNFNGENIVNYYKERTLKFN